MKFLGYIALACGVMVLLAAARPVGGGPPLDGRFGKSLRLIDERPMIPDIAFQEAAADGSTRDSGFVEFRGRVLVVMFWATWCPVCAQEMPRLDRVQAELGGKGLDVVALSQDDGGPAIVRAYFERHGLSNLRVFHDRDRVFASVLGVNAVPTTFVVDRNGRMVGVAEGAAGWDSPEALAFLRHYVEQPSSSG